MKKNVKHLMSSNGLKKLFSKDESPIISVCLPNFNHADYLSDNIKSIQSQSYRNWELIIVDDCSSDQSQRIIDIHATEDKRIKPIYLSYNQGANKAIQIAIEKACGDLFFGVAADDFLSNNQFFESVVEKIKTYPESSGVSGITKVIDSDTGAFQWEMGGGYSEYLPPSKALEEFCNGRMFLPGSSSVWKMQLIKKYGFHEDLGPQSDYYLNHAFAVLNGVCIINEEVAVMRRSEKSYSVSVSNDEFFRRHALVERRLRELVEKNRINDELFKKWRSNLINARLSYSYQKEAIDRVTSIISECPPWAYSGLTNDFKSIIQKCIDDLSENNIKLLGEFQKAHFYFEI